MARINVEFIGLWRIFLGVRSVTIEVTTIDAARDYIEANYGPIFRKKLKSSSIYMKQSIWDSSNILLNGKNISQLDNQVFKDGDKLCLLSKVAGG